MFALTNCGEVASGLSPFGREAGHQVHGFRLNMPPAARSAARLIVGTGAQMLTLATVASRHTGREPVSSREHHPKTGVWRSAIAHPLQQKVNTLGMFASCSFGAMSQATPTSFTVRPSLGSKAKVSMIFHVINCRESCLYAATKQHQETDQTIAPMCKTCLRIDIYIYIYGYKCRLGVEGR